MTDSQPLRAPFPWFGGKRRVAHIVWERLGDVKYYVEPFFGSGAVLLGRPREHEHCGAGGETVNDKDGLICNCWRAVSADPDVVAKHAVRPVNEAELRATEGWLRWRLSSLLARLEADIGYYDAEIAGRWVWAMACWIGSGYFKAMKGNYHGQPRAAPYSVFYRPDRQQELVTWLHELQARLACVRVLCGDWTRVLGPGTLRTGTGAMIGVFLDPPYRGSDLTVTAYAVGAGAHVAAAVEQWCRKAGACPNLRIALCGHVGDYDLPGWQQVRWVGKSGYASSKNTNRQRECVWFSPACLAPAPEATT